SCRYSYPRHGRRRPSWSASRRYTCQGPHAPRSASTPRCAPLRRVPAPWIFLCSPHFAQPFSFVSPPGRRITQNLFGWCNCGPKYGRPSGVTRTPGSGESALHHAQHWTTIQQDRPGSRHMAVTLRAHCELDRGGGVRKLVYLVGLLDVTSRSPYSGLTRRCWQVGSGEAWLRQDVLASGTLRRREGDKQWDPPPWSALGHFASTPPPARCGAVPSSCCCCPKTRPCWGCWCNTPARSSPKTRC